MPRKPPLPPALIPTAREMIARLGELTTIPATQRTTAVAAVRSYCKLIGQPKALDLVRVDPRDVLPAMDAATPVQLDNAPSTLRNKRAALRSAFRAMGLLAPVRSRPPAEAPAWAPLVAALPARFHPYRLRAFMAWCGGQGLSPDAVDDAVLERYLAERIASQGGQNQRAHVAEVARQWARMRDLIPGWPERELRLAPAPERVRTPPFSTYPETLQAEVERLRAWCATSAVHDLDADGPAQALAPATLSLRETGIRLLLWALIETGTPQAELTSLRCLVDRATAARALKFHRERLQAQMSGHLAGLADAVQLLLVFFRVEGEASAQMRKMLAKLRPPVQREISDEVAATLDALSEPSRRARLLALPEALMREARELRNGVDPVTGAQWTPDSDRALWLAGIAVGIEIELHLPLRVLDLSHLRLGETISLSEARKGRWEARIRVQTNKTGHLVEARLDGESANLVREYMEKFRPLARHAETAWLFPSRDHADRPRSEHHFSEAIAREVLRVVGVRVTAHGFRSFVACMILENDPHAWTDVAAVLGHTSLLTAQKHYARVNRLAAAERLSAGLRRQRKQLERVAPPPLPRPPRRPRTS